MAVDERDPLDDLADEFEARCPERAGEIRELFPVLAAMGREDRGSAEPRRPGVGPTLDRIGEYRLIREIGRGGMGVESEAEQEPPGLRGWLRGGSGPPPPSPPGGPGRPLPKGLPPHPRPPR